MENLAELIAASPQLAPGLIVGLVGGIGYGLNEDRKAGDGSLPHTWWSTGPVGALLGAVAWCLILMGS